MKQEAYPYFDKTSKAPAHLPDFSVDDVLDIDFKTLKDIGVKHVLFDLDLTLRRRNADKIEAEVIACLVDARRKGLIETVDLATNNMHNLEHFSKPLGARVFQPFRSGILLARKPSRAYFERILRELHAEPGEVAMVGDKALFDVAGGNRVGMRTILVAPRGGKDLWSDKVIFARFREKRLLKSARAALELVKASHQS